MAHGVLTVLRGLQTTKIAALLIMLVKWFGENVLPGY